jgi:hypothetical protein
MLIEKCDLCGKEVPRKEIVRVEYRQAFRLYGFCNNCAVPLLVFLNDNQLVEAVQ